MRSLSRRSRTQSSSPLQYSVPTKTTGKSWIFSVCFKVNASKISSSVPKPPGSATNAQAYFMNITLRAKK